MISFRPYAASDRDACLAIFDDNCPEFFALNEREDYAAFLSSTGNGYTVADVDGGVAGAYGLLPDGEELALRWILFSRAMQGRGLGARVMARVLDEMRDRRVMQLHIAASHRSAPFFARFGAAAVKTTQDGWGPGMHRVDMLLSPHA